MQHPDSTRRLNRAFSLIESLVVLATIGMLIFVLIPAFEIYILGQGHIEDGSPSSENGGLVKPGTYDIRFAPEEARQKALQGTEDAMPASPAMPVAPEQE